ncbi:hypothetical protein M5W83_04790 [Paenibacillus thiaminolyticus]|uniref:Uncharacterized protein n=1 Tax=Paenibacillus thiaminolyticus TaxID=49283 RepID=A0AAP9J4N2_PANTH|nr:hypothetical protein [Paenibacillus thiaminolyticus]MCY9606477.1 hypothetical protein [Paenibacillus thiaminolyticus]MCY9618614.1 hypothetical protein [Paenibacillus thiaminolyticus]MCY9623495.1 hypothetical protein [Paenibacillus thiaminolyticus]MCY9649725.1 hypothetical protein [Paenibacillus thiaminolyticus]MCY9743017.1 hypothetical protein [Paenibacillus thiaminolyticus]
MKLSRYPSIRSVSACASGATYSNGDELRTAVRQAWDSGPAALGWGCPFGGGLPRCHPPHTMPDKNHHYQSPAVPRWNDSAGAAIPSKTSQAVEIQACPKLSRRKIANEFGDQKKHLIALQVLFLYGGRD